MRMLPHTLTGFELLSYCYREQWGAVFQDAVYGRPDGTCRLYMVSDHPDFEDEEFELTEAEGAEWIKGEGEHFYTPPPEPGQTYFNAVRVRDGIDRFAVVGSLELSLSDLAARLEAAR